MIYAKTDQRIAGYLGRALSLEFSAVQQYSTQARLAAAWGLNDAAQRFQEEAREEMEHVDRIIARMLALGLAPNASMLRPARLGNSLRDLLVEDQLLENELVRLYADAATYCTHVADHDNRHFFHKLLEEEQAHGRELAEWLARIEQPAAPAGELRATF